MFLFFISPRNLRAASADRRETLPRDRKVLPYDNLHRKILGALPKEGMAVDHTFFRFWISPSVPEIFAIEV